MSRREVLARSVANTGADVTFADAQQTAAPTAVIIPRLLYTGVEPATEVTGLMEWACTSVPGLTDRRAGASPADALYVLP